MADKNEATGCGCLIVLAVICVAIKKIAEWVSENEATVNNGVDVVKQTGVWVLVAIVAFVVLKKISSYRKAIRHAEKNYLSVVLENHDFDGLMRRTRTLYESAWKAFPEIEKSLISLRHGLAEIRNSDTKKK